MLKAIRYCLLVICVVLVLIPIGTLAATLFVNPIASQAQDAHGLTWHLSIMSGGWGLSITAGRREAWRPASEKTKAKYRNTSMSVMGGSRTRHRRFPALGLFVDVSRDKRIKPAPPLGENPFELAYEAAYTTWYLGVWPRLFIVTYSFIAALAAITLVRRRLRRPPAVENPCPQCGYSLKGNLSGVCPECGKEAGPLVDTRGTDRFHQYDVVRVVGLSKPVGCYSKIVSQREPRVGDVATIVEVYENPAGYELECCDPSGGSPIWLESFRPDDVQLELVKRAEA